MEIQEITSKAFQKYGRILYEYDFTELVVKMQNTPLPEDGTVYNPSVQELEELDVSKKMKKNGYGETDIQVGYCNGNNHKLNAVEYHRSSEFDIAATDAILILGLRQDIEEDFTYETSKMEAFRVPAGVGVELFATTLHFAPCNAKEGGFQVAIVLPRGTNYPLEEEHETDAIIEQENGKMTEDRILRATNKWMIAHKDGNRPKEVFIGLKGENLTV